MQVNSLARKTNGFRSRRELSVLWNVLETTERRKSVEGKRWQSACFAVDFDEGRNHARNNQPRGYCRGTSNFEQPIYIPGAHNDQRFLALACTVKSEANRSVSKPRAVTPEATSDEFD